MGETLQPEKIYINGEQFEGFADLEAEPELELPGDVLQEQIIAMIERLYEGMRNIFIDPAIGNPDIMDRFLYLYAPNDNPRWWHIYTHTKKRRIRKKYRDKLMRQLASKMLSGEVHP